MPENFSWVIFREMHEMHKNQYENILIFYSIVACLKTNKNLLLNFNGLNYLMDEIFDICVKEATI